MTKEIRLQAIEKTFQEELDLIQKGLITSITATITVREEWGYDVTVEGRIQFETGARLKEIPEEALDIMKNLRIAGNVEFVREVTSTNPEDWCELLHKAFAKEGNC